MHDRIAKALDWTEAEVKSFSWMTLRELVRTVDKKLAHEMTVMIRTGEYIIGEPYKPGRRIIRY